MARVVTSPATFFSRLSPSWSEAAFSFLENHMNVIADATDPESPVRAPALATLIARQPEVKQVGTGAGYSCLTPWGVFIATEAAATPSTTSDLDEALGAIIRGWVLRMEQVGLTPLVMTMTFDDQPPVDAQLSRADAEALFKSLAAPMYAAGFDPTWGTYIVSMSRRHPEEAIEAVSVATVPPCDEQTRISLIAAAKSWLAARRSFFQSHQQVHLEVNAASTAGGEVGIAEAAELDLLCVPAAGTA